MYEARVSADFTEQLDATFARHHVIRNHDRHPFPLGIKVIQQLQSFVCRFAVFNIDPAAQGL
ncbi:Uncharacterised protein [Vibrio cholerae]|nr:Uncharacterised protein [Vibrio cholerae]